MLKKTLALVCLTLSLTVNADIVNKGRITHDTATGLDWMDLSHTTNRSYNEISGLFADGQEFSGWRYATQAEVKQLWGNFGITAKVRDKDDTSQRLPLIKAIEILGNTIKANRNKREGVVGIARG